MKRGKHSLVWASVAPPVCPGHWCASLCLEVLVKKSTELPCPLVNSHCLKPPKCPHASPVTKGLTPDIAGHPDPAPVLVSRPSDDPCCVLGRERQPSAPPVALLPGGTSPFPLFPASLRATSPHYSYIRGLLVFRLKEILRFLSAQ